MDVVHYGQQQSYTQCLPKLQVRVRRIQIFPLFEDYDRVHIGSVTRSQVNKGFIDVHDH